MFKWKNILIAIFRRKTVLWFIAIIAITLATRLFQIEELPPGLNNDEVSQGYNAFSLLHTGKDRYGQDFPILFKSYYSFQAPLYTYFTIIPNFFFGNSILSVRIVSAVSGIILVAITFLLLNNFEKRKNINIATLAALTLCLSPWAVFFSRIGTEASLGLALFALSFLMFYLSLKKLSFFPLATLILGLSTHAYYSERIISILFLIVFSLLFKNTILSNKKIFIVGLSIFILTQIPHLLIANTEAFTRRIEEVNYFTIQLDYFPFGRPLFIIREFLSQYLTYFSPKNLFFDPDPQPQRSIPNLSVFYNWMLVPYLLGIGLFFKRRSAPLIKMLVLVMLIGPIPASLTRDPFYTLRTLIFLWTITIMIALGINEILNKFHLKFISEGKNLFIKFSLVLFIVLYSSLSLYISYFILFKYERTSFDYSYMELLEKIEQFPKKKFVVDNSRHIGVGLRIAFFNKYDPSKLQQLLKSAGNYYSTAKFDESYILDDIEVKPIDWGEANCKEQILVGDLLSISVDQVKDHNLSHLFDIKDIAGDVSFKAYLTNPDSSCSSNNGKT